MKNNPYRAILSDWLKLNKLAGKVSDFSGGIRVKTMDDPETCIDQNLVLSGKYQDDHDCLNADYDGLEIEGAEELDLDAYIWIDFVRPVPFNDIIVLGISPEGEISKFEVDDPTDPTPFYFVFDKRIHQVADSNELIQFLDEALRTGFTE
ncbi:MAG: hypothetical protein WCK17_06275 [Verrucomicrobiota bacterium]